jgi:hypothetical protein
MHIDFSSPARQLRREAFCGGRASSPSLWNAAFGFLPSAFSQYVQPEPSAGCTMS